MKSRGLLGEGPEVQGGPSCLTFPLAGLDSNRLSLLSGDLAYRLSHLQPPIHLTPS